MMILGLTHEDDAAPEAAELVLLRRSAEDDLSFLVVPDGVGVKEADGTLTELGALYASGGESGTRQALSELLRLEINASLVFDAHDIVAFVDDIGGLPIVIEETVRFAAGAAAGGELVVLEPGERTLTGAEAIAYLRGSSDVRRAARLLTFIRAVIAHAFYGLSDRDARDRAQAIRELAQSDLSSTSIQELARRLTSADPELLRLASVPTEESIIDGQRVLHPRVVEMERLLASAMRGIEFLTPTYVRIAVFNGNGIRLMASQTADYLRARGFEVTRIANAESFAYATSYIVVLTDEAKAWVLRDALPSQVSIVFPDAFEEHMSALEELIPFGTDLLLIAGAGMELE